MTTDLTELKQSLAGIKGRTEILLRAMTVARIVAFTYEERKLIDLLIEQCNTTLILIKGYETLIAEHENSTD